MMLQLTNPEILRELGARLKAYRLQQNVPVEELAARAGLSKTTIVNAEAGRNPRLETVVRILRGLRKLDTLEGFLPEPTVSPIELLERGSKTPRKHAYPRRRRDDRG